MYIIGISAYYHDSAAVLLHDGIVVAAAQEERFTRVKNDPSFPRHAIAFCLSEAAIRLSEVDLIVFYDKPFLKFERILETFYRHAPFGFVQFLKGIPLWVKEKMFFKQMLRKELKSLGDYDPSRTKLLFSEHHLSHAASAFFPSFYGEAAILTVDGVGEWATLSIAKGQGNRIRIIKEMHFPDSVGLFYSAFTYYLGFRVHSGEYKMMGLAPYGDRQSAETLRFVRLIKDRLVTIHADGSLTMNLAYFNYQKSMTMVNENRWHALFGFRRRRPEAELKPEHTHLACAAQLVTEEIMLKLCREAKRLTGSSSLCLAGGVALNCVANGMIAGEGLFERIFIQPASGDSGGALGAALAVYYIYSDHARKLSVPDAMQGALLGPSYTDADIRRFVESGDIPCRYIPGEKQLCSETARLLSEGNCIGWFQGRMEFGPRALGNRSILADPRNPEMQQRVNLKIKYRESFRPFAPAILKEEAKEYFDCPQDSAYMLLTAPIRDTYKKVLPPGYSNLSVAEKLAVPKSAFPAVTHVDYSSRLQTVDGEVNPLFGALLSAFRELTGCPMLINTSFNVRGEPIVCTPEDAFRCFMSTEMDYLVLGNYLFDKRQCRK